MALEDAAQAVECAKGSEATSLRGSKAVCEERDGRGIATTKKSLVSNHLLIETQQTRRPAESCRHKLAHQNKS